jgi:MoaA/NifB/PqqE/SkfB family radical SAM enzyme
MIVTRLNKIQSHSISKIVELINKRNCPLGVHFHYINNSPQGEKERGGGRTLSLHGNAKKKIHPFKMDQRPFYIYIYKKKRVTLIKKREKGRSNLN